MRARLTVSACALAAIVVLNSCDGKLITEVPNRPLSIVFGGFSYVGQFHGGNVAELPLHGIHGLLLPNEIEPGVRYVFHYPAEKEDSDSPLEIIPKRLRSLGFVAPEPTDIFSLSSGGPVYEIKFWRGSCTGSIWHGADKELMTSRWPWDKRWEPDDTILTVGPGCNL